MLLLRRLSAAVFVACGIAAGAAATTLDQEALPLASGLTFLHDNDTTTRQEFVAGRSGLLTQIDLYVADLFGGVACCTLSVFDDSQQNALSSASIDAAHAAPGWISFVLATPLQVAAGQHLFFDVEHDNILALAAADYTAGALDWSCNFDGCANPFRASPQFATDRLADGSLVVFCAEPSGDCSAEWSGPFDPSARNVDPYVGLHMPIDYAFRSFVVSEPALLPLLGLGLAALGRRRRAG
jgi:hypothetical protein